MRKAYDRALSLLIEAKISFPQRAAEFDALARELSAVKSMIDDILAQAAKDEDLAGSVGDVPARSRHRPMSSPRLSS